jgi:hypothetical protein
MIIGTAPKIIGGLRPAWPILLVGTSGAGRRGCRCP